MKRGEFYRVYRGSKYDPKDYRVYLVVSRQKLVDSDFSTVACAPVYSRYDGRPTQVEVGADEGLKHDSAVWCDALTSIQKSDLTDYVGCVRDGKLETVNAALRVALGVE